MAELKGKLLEPPGGNFRNRALTDSGFPEGAQGRVVYQAHSWGWPGLKRWAPASHIWQDSEQSSVTTVDSAGVIMDREIIRWSQHGLGGSGPHLECPESRAATSDDWTTESVLALLSESDARFFWWAKAFVIGLPILIISLAGLGLAVGHSQEWCLEHVSGSIVESAAYSLVFHQAVLLICASVFTHMAKSRHQEAKSPIFCFIREFYGAHLAVGESLGGGNCQSNSGAAPLYWFEMHPSKGLSCGGEWGGKCYSAPRSLLHIGPKSLI